MFDGSCRSNGREEEERDEEILDCERHCSCKDMKKSSLPRRNDSCGTFACAYIKKRKSCEENIFSFREHIELFISENGYLKHDCTFLNN